MKAYKTSLDNISKGNHQISDKMNLIQIVDPDMEFPTPKHDFKENIKVKFYDVDSEASDGISEEQSRIIFEFILDSYKSSHDLMIHCVAGINRSGGVLGAAEAIGFKLGCTNETYNTFVKSQILKNLYKE
jgi:predicted protein tyrosine phosphatase